MKHRYSDLPESIVLDVPRGRKCTIVANNGQVQEFSTDDLPSKLFAKYEGIKEVSGILREVRLAQYSVEPIFNLQVFSENDFCGNRCYDIESMNKLCQLISLPWMYSIRSSMLQDEFVEKDTEQTQYWLYNPNDRYTLSFFKNGKIWETSVVFCEGYYYEIDKSKDEDPVIKKIVDEHNLPIKKPKPVKPVFFVTARAIARAEKMSLAIA